MTLPPFGLTYDYRCPFARIAHEHVLTALRDGADWDVHFVPFSLTQAHVEEGEPAVWDEPGRQADLLAVAASLVVRDRFADRFLDVHAALFGLRHDEGRDLRDESVVAAALASAGVDADPVLAEVRAGGPLATFRQEHERAVSEHHVFGVPTFIVGGRAAFVRLLQRPAGDPALARSTVERVVDLVDAHPSLNELKHTSIPR
jgi:protein-disulfide isomerase-like protein with CxxC motif